MKAILILCAGVLVTTIGAANEVFAFGSATVRSEGPVAGSDGKNFMSAVGHSYGSLASYGVFDIDASEFAFSGPYNAIPTMRLNIWKWNEGPTHYGAFRLWLATDTSISIQPGSELHYDSTTLYGLAPGQLGTLYSVGTGVYDVGDDGDGRNYGFGCSEQVESILLDAVANGSTLRFVITQDEFFDDMAAGMTGYSNPVRPGPSVDLMAALVPEPTTLAVLGLGGLALLRRCKQRHRSKPKPGLS